MKRNLLTEAAPQLIFAGFIIVVGCLFLLDNMGVLDAGDFFDYWPLVFVIIGLVRVAQAGSPGGQFIGFLIALVGLLWILDNTDVITFSVWDYWPVALILTGIAIIWKTLGRATERVPAGEKSAGEAGFDTGIVNGVAILGGYKRTVNTPDFRGGTLTAFMGGCEIDLRESSISSGEASIDILAIWGGIELKVPEDWVVQVRGMPILGGFDDKTRPPRDHSKRLIVTGMAIMGGVEIRN